MNNITDQLKRDEGICEHAYTDSLGYITIGCGRLIDARKTGSGLRPAEIDYLLNNDIEDRIFDLTQRLTWFPQLDDARRGVIVNMAYQLGLQGLMGFQSMLAAAARGDWPAASAAMLDSKWALQTPARAQRLALQMTEGVWH